MINSILFSSLCCFNILFSQNPCCVSYNHDDVLMERYLDLPDPNETTGWHDAYALNNATTPGVFGENDYYDFYTYSTNKYEALAITVSSQYTENVFIYKNSTSTLLFNYSSSIQLSYSSFQPYLVYTSPGDSFFIKIARGNTPIHYYDIQVNSNPNLSGVSILSHDTYGEPTQYYGSAGTNEIKYRITNSSNVIIGTTKTYADVYAEALQIWNYVGNLHLALVASGENVVLDTCDRDTMTSMSSQSAVGLTFYNIASINGAVNFSASHVYLLNSSSLYGDATTAYSYALECALHEIGHTLGLKHCGATTPHNIMHAYMFQFDGWIGDGDIASYKYIWGSL